MEKPITMVIEDTKKQIAEIVNKSGLMPVILEPMFKDLYQEISVLMQRQAQSEKEEYEKALAEEEIEKAEKKNKDDSKKSK